jgi:hypothetical protein
MVADNATGTQSDVYGIMFYMTLKILHILGDKLHLSDEVYAINAAVYSI